jgi:sugar phosphate permease
MAEWFAVFLTRHRGLSVDEAGSAVGTVTVVGGLLGTALGGLLADRLRGWTRQPYLALSGFSMVLAAAAAGVALMIPEARACVLWIGVAQFFLWFYNGPINALIANSVPAAIMARAFSVSILAIHLLGDAISPPIIGALSDATHDLPGALRIVPVMLGLGAAVWLWGWWTIPEAETPPGAQVAPPPH